MLKRINLVSQKVVGNPARPSLGKLMREGSYLFSPLTRRFRPSPKVNRARDAHIIMLLPGFLASPSSMAYLARQIERAGHKSKRWGTGLNLGPTPERFGIVEQRLADIHRRHGQPVVLLGWSLGGLFARELARRHPERVAKVITMGSPFSHDPRSNNAWRLYQLVTGHSVDEIPIEVDVRSKPPVETVALWSPRDGVVAPQAACGLSTERDRAVELRCTHMGFAYSAESIEAVLRELEG